MAEESVVILHLRTKTPRNSGLPNPFASHKRLRALFGAVSFYPPMSAEGSLLLLIVDDDLRILELAEHAARASRQFEIIVTAEHGKDALLKVFGAPRLPDVILTDLSMPQMDGFELVRTLKELSATKHIPVFMFSSSGLLYDQQHALEAGCTAFFPKPATLADLKTLMENIAQIVLGLETAQEPGLSPAR